MLQFHVIFQIENNFLDNLILYTRNGNLYFFQMRNKLKLIDILNQ